MKINVMKGLNIEVFRFDAGFFLFFKTFLIFVSYLSFFFVEQLSLAIITLMNTKATTSQTIGSSLTKPRTSRSRSQNFTNNIGQWREREMKK